MLVRIVKMSFDTESIDLFLSNFHEHKNEIRNFEGCHLLELYRDKQHSHVFFTYSYWEDASYLELYRQSDLFKSVWSKTKALFNDKPQAWSVDKVVSLP
ncbi:MAG: antibiotic biosynthesis monooxygenase [Bacteroidia bacterium]|nr:antibiotic biosynthesis monooxygenase [Bacteroidia bacterium]NND51879.1 antibiotic biosynthesis monooxygenase [Flavobacteriaceae bacterium]